MELRQVFNTIAKWGWLIGLADRGHLVLGARADIIRVTRIGTAGAVRGVWAQGRRVA